MDVNVPEAEIVRYAPIRFFLSVVLLLKVAFLAPSAWAEQRDWEIFTAKVTTVRRRRALRRADNS